MSKEEQSNGLQEQIDNLHGKHSPQFGEEHDVLLSSRSSVSHFETDPSAQSTSIQAFFTLTKVFIGSGVLTLPYSFKNTGVGVSIAVTALLGVLTYYCTHLILKVADDNNAKMHEKISYSRLAHNVLKKYGKISVKISLVVMQIGVCIGLFILANKFLEHAFCTYEVAQLCGNRVFTIFLCALMTIPLCFINNMHYFYIPNFMGFIFLVIGLGTQTIYNIQQAEQVPNFGSITLEEFRKFDLARLPLLFGVCIFAYEGIGVVFDIRASMKEPKTFRNLFKVEIIFLMLVYCLFPALCVVALGDNLPEIVLFSLPKDNLFFLFIQIAYVFSGLLGYPTQFYPAIKIIENTSYLKHLIFNKDGTTKNAFLRYGIRIFLICVLLLIANVTKSFNLFLNFLGSFVFTYVGYLLPIWIYNSYFKGKINVNEKIVNGVSFAISALCGLSGIVMTLIAFIDYDDYNGN